MKLVPRLNLRGRVGNTAVVRRQHAVADVVREHEQNVRSRRRRQPRLDLSGVQRDNPAQSGRGGQGRASE